MPSYQYREIHCGDKTILHIGISYVYWYVKCHFTSIGNPIVKIRQSYNHLISTMGFPILIRWHLYIESGPRYFLWHISNGIPQATCTYLWNESISCLWVVKPARAWQILPCTRWEKWHWIVKHNNIITFRSLTIFSTFGNICLHFILFLYSEILLDPVSI